MQSNSEAPNLGAYGNTTHELTQNLNQHLVLRTPDLYKDWERDKQLTIRWDSFGNIANAPDADRPLSGRSPTARNS